MPSSLRHTSARALIAGASAMALATAAMGMEPTPPTATDEAPQLGDRATPAPTRIIVKYVETDVPQLESPAAAQAAAETLGALAGVEATHVRALSGGAQLIEVPVAAGASVESISQSVADIAARMAESPIVEYAEPDSFMTIEQAVNDPQFPQQWHYTQANTGVNAPDAWALNEGAGVTVAVIDTGHRPHADLTANIVGGFDFISHPQVANDGDLRDADASDPGDWIDASDASWCPASPRNSSWHGTHVAGTVAALTDNSLGVAGVAHKAKIVSVRVLGKCGGLLSDIADGMRWAAGLAVPGVPANPNPADVLNLSLGGGGACGAVYQDAIDDIVAAGATVVVAAGNSNGNAANYRPAGCDNIIAVASTKRDGGRAYYSNFGGVVEIAAPGGETPWNAADGVLSTLNTGATTPGADSYAFYQGTSMAAPHVAGVVALLYSADPAMTPAEALSIIENTAQPFPAVAERQCDTANCGAGIIDAAAALGEDDDHTVASQGWMRLLLNN